MDDKEKLEKLAQLIIDSNNIIVLSGAGMSTESGIADFRTPNTGLWETVDPYEFGDIRSYVNDTGNYFKMMLEVGLAIFRAKPNKGHKALTRLQKLGKLHGILTQNIDNLHKKARTKCEIVELHGTVTESKCMKCKKIFPITTLVNKVLSGKSVTCDECNGLLKPNAIFFGEPLEFNTLARADKLIDDCDLLIVLGSSLLVSPVSFYPARAISHGAKVAIINIQDTYIDAQAEVVIHDKIGDIFPLIVDLVEQKLSH
ncbi:MAG: NAD-dependent deacetylase [Promethearchaeota archaeon]